MVILIEEIGVCCNTVYLILMLWCLCVSPINFLTRMLTWNVKCVFDPGAKIRDTHAQQRLTMTTMQHYTECYM